MIELLVSSKTRVKLLYKFFLNSNTSAYLRGLEAEFGGSTNKLRKELINLEGIGLLSSVREGKKKIFQANNNHPFYSNIHNLLLHETGLSSILKTCTQRLPDLAYVFVLGKLARGHMSNTIDFVFVGDIDTECMVELLRKSERKLGKKINYLCFNTDEFTSAELDRYLHNYLLLWSK
jgi:hypothetical protein